MRIELLWAGDDPSGIYLPIRSDIRPEFRQVVATPELSTTGPPPDREFQRYGTAKNKVAKTWLTPSQRYGRPVRTRTADLYRVNLESEKGSYTQSYAGTQQLT